MSPKPLDEKQLTKNCMKKMDVLISSMASPKAEDPTVLNGGPGVFNSLSNLEKVNGKFRKIIHIIANVDMLKHAYNQIKSKPGNLTPGADTETLDGISDEWFQKASRALITGDYTFKTNRRIDIPKPKGGTRPLTIGNPRDKIIQKACELVLNHIYETKLNKFSDKSHGFRPNRSCHTALEQIKYKWKAIPWYLEFYLKKAFDTINRRILINIIEEEIEDRAVVSLINKMYNAKILKGKELLTLNDGVTQGNILSPLLSNIYFSKLDEFLEHTINKYHKGDKPTLNNEYLRNIHITEEEKIGKTEEQLKNLKNSKSLIARQKGLRPTILDDTYMRVTYVRYADDFIIGVRGSKDTAKKIFNEVKNFIRSSLHLDINEEKSNITHIYSEWAHFLGMQINCTPTSQIPFRRAAHIERFKRLQLRVQRKIDLAEDKRIKQIQLELMKWISNNIKQNGKEETSNSIESLLKNLLVGEGNHL